MPHYQQDSGNQDWDWLPNAARGQGTSDLDKARENAPAVVFGEIGLVLAVTLGIALLINLLLIGLRVS